MFVCLTLSHANRFSKHDQIGEVKIPLNTIDLAQTIEEWRPLTKVESDNDQVSHGQQLATVGSAESQPVV